MNKVAQQFGLGTIIFLMIVVIGFVTFIAAYPMWDDIIGDFAADKDSMNYSAGLVLLIKFYPLAVVLFFVLLVIGTLVWGR